MKLSEEVHETAKEAGIYGNWLKSVAKRIEMLENRRNDMNKGGWNKIWAAVIALAFVTFSTGVYFEILYVEFMGFGLLLSIIAFGVVRER